MVKQEWSQSERGRFPGIRLRGVLLALLVAPFNVWLVVWTNWTGYGIPAQSMIASAVAGLTDTEERPTPGVAAFAGPIVGAGATRPARLIISSLARTPAWSA